MREREKEKKEVRERERKKFHSVFVKIEWKQSYKAVGTRTSSNSEPHPKKWTVTSPFE